MRIKVCGMKYFENILQLNTLFIQMIGFIFYKKSPRYIGNLELTRIKNSKNILRVGVFVNETFTNILHTLYHHKIYTVQLHGTEHPKMCQALQNCGITVIKAFSIENINDLNKCTLYEKVCDYFLFDTKVSQWGGSGKKFNWQILYNYFGKIPFFLSGGISIKDIDHIKQFNHPLLHAIDLNSQFEICPGMKDIDKIRSFISNFQ